MVLSEVIRVKEIKLGNGKKFIGFEIDLPGAPLVLIKGEKGFVMCGYLNIDVVNKLGTIAARVTGVKTVEDMLKSVIKEASEKAIEEGIKPGMKVEEVLSKI